LEAARVESCQGSKLDIIIQPRSWRVLGIS